MNTTALLILRKIMNGVNDQNILLNNCNIKKWQFNHLMGELEAEDFVERGRTSFHLKNNAKCILLRDVAKKYDVVKLLHDSNEIVYAALTTLSTLTELQHATKLSRATIYRSVTDLESIGAVNNKNNQIIISGEKSEPLYLFAQMLSNERKRDDIKAEDSTEVIYQDISLILKKIPKDKKSDGELTAFSLFSNFGIEYHTTHDYYAEQVSDLKIEDILVHAILISSNNSDKNGLGLSILFYLKNKDKMDLLEIKRVTRKLKILDVWLDVENFLRHNPVRNEKLFLPWDEFESKAELYNIPAGSYKIPKAYPNLFSELSKMIESDITLYLIGGENMRIKGLKERTKDCDLVLDDEQSIMIIARALEKIGYRDKDKVSFSKDEKRVQPFTKLTHITGTSDIEIFYNTIARKFYLSERMKNRSKKEIFSQHHNLRLCLLSNEDIFLLKAVTDREGDIYDMTRLVQYGNFNWSTVWSELEEQIKETGHHFYNIFLYKIEQFIESTGIKPPFFKKLIQKSIEENICKLIVKHNGLYLDKLVSWLMGEEISERQVRSRVDSLARKGLIRKYESSADGNRVFLRARKTLMINFKKRNDLLDQRYYVNYNSVIEHIERLCTRLQVSDQTLETAKKIAEKVCTDPSFIANRPRNLAALILYRSVLINRENKTKTDVEEAAGISKVSITLLMKKFKRQFPDI